MQNGDCVSKGFGDIMKQAQQMQAKMAQAQQELAAKRVEASVGGGAVVVTADGQQNIISITIAPDAVKSGDHEMVQELVLTGVNEALKKSRDLAAVELSKVTGDLNLPGMF
jgi:DNA-binding YbaB/EbfC family protein